jgi:hypothetical protein
MLGHIIIKVKALTKQVFSIDAERSMWADSQYASKQNTARVIFSHH